MNKANLVNLGSSLNPPLILTMEDKKGDMIEKILGSEPRGDVISVDNPTGEPASDTPRPERNAKDLPRLGKLYDLQGNQWDGKYFKVTVHATETNRGMVEPQINGHLIRFRRGVEVVIPEPYVRVLQNAVTRTAVKDPETKETRILELQMYPMSVEGPVEGPTRIVA